MGGKGGDAGGERRGAACRATRGSTAEGGERGGGGCVGSSGAGFTPTVASPVSVKPSASCCTSFARRAAISASYRETCARCSSRGITPGAPKPPLTFKLLTLSAPAAAAADDVAAVAAAARFCTATDRDHMLPVSGAPLPARRAPRDPPASARDDGVGADGLRPTPPARDSKPAATPDAPGGADSK